MNGHSGWRCWERIGFPGCVLEAPVVSVSGLSSGVAPLGRSVRVFDYIQVALWSCDFENFQDCVKTLLK